MAKTSPRKSEAARRANQVIRGRTLLMMVLLGIVTFLLLFWKLYDLQINQHEKLQADAVKQQTSSTVVTASRGTIYDRSGSTLAMARANISSVLKKAISSRGRKPILSPIRWLSARLIRA